MDKKNHQRQNQNLSSGQPEESFLRQSAMNVHKFRELAIQYSQLSEMAGVPIAAYREGSADRFARMEIHEQENILGGLQLSVDICLSAIQNNVKVERHNLSLVWWALQRLGLRPGSDLFTELKNNDLIEIYNKNSVQLFRTFNMFGCISYSIEEVFSHTWWELFRHDEHVMQQMLKATEIITKQEVRSTVFLGTPPHEVEERFSPRRRKAVLDMRLFAPLFDQNGRIGGYVVASKILQVIDQCVDHVESDEAVTPPPSLFVAQPIGQSPDLDM